MLTTNVKGKYQIQIWKPSWQLENKLMNRHTTLLMLVSLSFNKLQPNVVPVIFTL